MVSKEEIMAALKDVMDPELHISIVNLRMVKEIAIQGDKVKVAVALTVGGCPLSETIAGDVKKSVMKLGGVKSVDVETTVMTKEELGELRKSIQSQMAAAQTQKSSGGMPPGINRLERKGVRNVLAIMSGKGGVGKSFVTGFLAVQLARLGYKVGILDCGHHWPKHSENVRLERPTLRNRRETSPPRHDQNRDQSCLNEPHTGRATDASHRARPHHQQRNPPNVPGHRMGRPTFLTR